MVFKYYNSLLLWLPNYAKVENKNLLLEQRQKMLGIIPTFKTRENIKLANIQSLRLKTHVHFLYILVALILIFSTFSLSNLFEIIITCLLILIILDNVITTELTIEKAGTNTVIKSSIFSRNVILKLENEIRQHLGY